MWRIAGRRGGPGAAVPAPGTGADQGARPPAGQYAESLGINVGLRLCYILPQLLSEGAKFTTKLNSFIFTPSRIFVLGCAGVRATGPGQHAGVLQTTVRLLAVPPQGQGAQDSPPHPFLMMSVQFYRCLHLKLMAVMLFSNKS